MHDFFVKLMAFRRKLVFLDGKHILVDSCFTVIEEGFVFVKCFAVWRNAVDNGCICNHKITEGDVTHCCDDLMALFESDSRSFKETLIKTCKFEIKVVVLRACLDSLFSSLYKETVKRNEEDCDDHIEDCVEVCDSALCNRVIPEGKADYRLYRIHTYHKYDSTDKVKVKMHHSGSSCILACADRGHKGCDTCTDVLAEDDRNSSRIGNCARCRNSLKNTDRSRGALDSCCYESTDENAENRVFECCKHCLESRKLTQTCNGGFHCIHTDEKNAEAEKNFTDILHLALLLSHHEQKADSHSHIGKI